MDKMSFFDTDDMYAESQGISPSKNEATDNSNLINAKLTGKRDKQSKHENFSSEKNTKWNGMAELFPTDGKERTKRESFALSPIQAAALDSYVYYSAYSDGKSGLIRAALSEYFKTHHDEENENLVKIDLKRKGFL